MGSCTPVGWCLYSPSFGRLALLGLLACQWLPSRYGCPPLRDPHRWYTDHAPRDDRLVHPSDQHEHPLAGQLLYAPCRGYPSGGVVQPQRGHHPYWQRLFQSPSDLHSSEQHPRHGSYRDPAERIGTSLLGSRFFNPRYGQYGKKWCHWQLHAELSHRQSVACHLQPWFKHLSPAP